MNIIDNVLSHLKSMSADDVIQAMGEIYNAPIERDLLFAYPQFIQDIVFLIDLDTELSMDGIGGLLENSTGKYIPNMIAALKNIQAYNEGDILLNIYEIYKVNPNDKSIDELANRLYLYTGYDFWGLLETYVNNAMRTL